MADRPPFAVDTLIICDYVTNDSAGMPIYAGVHHGDIVFSSEPTNWPLLNLCAVIQPFAAEFDFLIQVTKPNGDTWVKFEVHHKASRPPRSYNRLNLNWQMPPGKFGGAGQYAVSFLANDVVVHRENFSVVIEKDAPFEVQIDIKMLIPPVATTA